MQRIEEAADTLYVTKTKDHRELDRLAALLNEYAEKARNGTTATSAMS